MSQNDSPTGKSSSELRVCVLRCVRDVRASDVERSKRVCECESECVSEWESERESMRESAVAKADWRKILLSALRPASRGSLSSRCLPAVFPLSSRCGPLRLRQTCEKSSAPVCVPRPGVRWLPAV